MTDLDGAKKLYGNTPPDMLKLSEPIPISRVDFRVQSISASGWATLLAYKDARVDMDRLDNVIGRGFWQRRYDRIGKDLFCTVSIWNREIKQWIDLQDVGVPSTTEAVKGESSDAFKRACFNLGIGRELYEYPLILVELNENEFRVLQDGQKSRGQATYDLRLSEWTWHSEWSEPDEYGKQHLTVLKAVDDKGNQRYQWPRGSASQRPPAPASAQPSQSSGAPAGTLAGKEWYNDFDNHKDYLQSQLNAGMSHDDILKKLREKWKVNKKTETSIRALVKQ